jgi:hypothetical protein
VTNDWEFDANPIEKEEETKTETFMQLVK